MNTALEKEKKQEMRETGSTNLDANVIDVSQFLYTPYYCEENVYLLCKKLKERGVSASDGSDLFVVFISNDNKQIPLWHQKASKRADGIVLWDYHVICIQRRNGDTPHLVWDLDSSLPFPAPLDLYVSETIRPSFPLFSEFERFSRIVHAPIFLRCFASDRRHMKDPDGNWLAEPPSYDAITAADGSVHNLNEYMEIHASDELATTRTDPSDSVLTHKLGVVVSANQLVNFFSQVS